MKDYRVLYISTPEELDGVIPEIRKLYEKDSTEYPDIYAKALKCGDLANGMQIIILDNETGEWCKCEDFFHLLDIREFTVTKPLKLGELT